MTKIYLTLSRKRVMESTDIDTPASKKHKLWFQGGGFEVYVHGTLKHSGLTHAQVAHAAMVAVQASGGKVSKLYDVRKPPPRKPKVKHSPTQRKLL